MKQFREFEANLSGGVKELEELLERSRKKIDKLATIESKNYANFIKPFIMIDEYLEQFFTPFSHINSVLNSQESQKTYTQMLPMMSAYSTQVNQNEALYNGFKTIKIEEYGSLNREQKRVVDSHINMFELNGAALSKGKKELLEEINIRLSEINNNFSQNILNATDEYELIIENEDDIKSLPRSDIEAAIVEKNGKISWRFTLQIPSYIAYMTYGNNREIREELYRAYSSRAPQNSEIIDEILALRHEEAQLLGFKSYADLSLATKMAPSTSEVLSFLNELATSSKPQGFRELSTLIAIAKEDGIDKIESFDTAYYSEKLKEREYKINAEEYRPYFELDQVVNGTFKFLNRLIGIEFKEVNIPLWHEGTRAYNLYENGTLKARLYTDLEARKNKKGGAWMHNWETHCSDEKRDILPASAFVVCNFPPSSSSSPSLLRHDDVVTLFHEMGHAIHHLLSNAEEISVSGIHNVEWDAVEFPSQFLENFAYEPAVLKLFAKDYRSGELLPDEMIERLKNAKNFQSAAMMLRQLEFALFDFRLHAKFHQGEKVQKLLNEVRKEVSLLTPPEYNRFQNSFSHIFAGGYGAGYYSYKWAEVLSADAFFYFIDNNIFDEEITSRYRTVILGRGGSETMLLLFEELMGRKLNSDALLRLSGIEK